MNQQRSSDEKIVMKVSANTMIGNIVLSILKLLAGIIAHSGAMISDAVHSASDVFSTIVVMIGFKMASKEADEDHQYGHERLECVAAILLAVILAATGIGIGMSGLEKVFTNSEVELQTPGQLALAAAILSIVVKEGMYWYTRAAAKQINSSALMADAWHHRSDAFSSVGSMIGIIGARMGFPICDPIASIVICIFIIKAAIDIFRDAIGKMTDRACDPEVVKQIRECILKNRGVDGVDKLQTRLFGSKKYVDVEILVDGSISLEKAHQIAEHVHESIEQNFSDVKHCMVHVNPESKEEMERKNELAN